MCYRGTRREQIMSKTETIRARVAPKLKRDAQAVLHRIGLTSSEAITLFLTQVTLAKGLPFPVRLPNKETKRALKEARERRDIETFDSAAEWAKTIRAL
jgi:DNA-damage-inducible protein J